MSRLDSLGRRSRRMPSGSRRTAAIALFFLALSTSAAFAGVLEDRLKSTRSEGRQVEQQLTTNEKRQQVVVQQISSLNGRIADLQAPIDQLSSEVANLDARIAARRKRITKLEGDFKRQAVEIVRLNAELASARKLLETRVVAAYMTGDTGMVEQLAGAGNLRDLFERQEALGKVVGLDQDIIDTISGTQRTVRIKRAGNHKLRSDIRADIASLDDDRADVEAKRATIESKQGEIEAVKAQRDAALKGLQGKEKELGKRLDTLEHDAKALKEAIETGQTTYGGQVGSVSPAGLIWPVTGPVVSPFGQRWGRLHAGIDIAIGAGNPIHAAASGVVTYASWMSGYGNMVIVQHGGGLSTGYAHQSQIAAKVGQTVSQGQVIGFVGCTGHCYGDHVHFETRVNGNPQDPMRYL